jgi:nicotinamide-nucleotide amidase
MTSYVLPELKKRFSREHIEHITIMTAGVGESFLAEKIRHWEQALPHHIKLAYLPNLSQVRLRLSGRGSDLQVLKKEMQQAVEHLIPIIDQNIFSLLDEGIEVAVGKLLQTKHMTVATAESCTGGYMAHKITSVPGSSDWYRGSVVAYQNDLKEQLLQVNHETLLQHGAVSEETVKQMANQVRLLLKSDYGIAISGIAGPEGGSDEKPLGTVWVAIADHDTVYTKKFLFTRSRLQNIEMSALNALFMLYRVIKGNFTQS